MNTTGLNLLIPDKPDLERDAVATSFERYGGAVHRVARFWEPPAFEPSTVRVYGPDTFCLVLQHKLGLTFCSPDDELLSRVPPNFLNRRIIRSKLGELAAVHFPAFVKPVTPKQFRSAVYESRNALDAECRGLADSTVVLVSEPVSFVAEIRTFLKDGLVLDACAYEGEAQSGAPEFVTALARAVSLPETVVIDLGFMEGRGWAVIEFNATWGAGLNGCDPDKVLPAIVAASTPAAVADSSGVQ